MKIEIDTVHFINGLAEKYGFERDQNGKVKIRFAELTIEEIMDIVNRYFNDDLKNGWRVYKIDDDDIVVDMVVAKNHYSPQQFKLAFV